jgi:hypothetical protein
MSTPAYKKRMRQHQQAEAKRKREFDMKYGLFSKPTKSKTKDFTPLEVKEPYRRETKEYPSLSTSDRIPTGTCAPAETKRYTGDLIVGIATMHKSNAVPIMRGTSQAKEISQMSN